MSQQRHLQEAAGLPQGCSPSRSHGAGHRGNVLGAEKGPKGSLSPAITTVMTMVTGANRRPSRYFPGSIWAPDSSHGAFTSHFTGGETAAQRREAIGPTSRSWDSIPGSLTPQSIPLHIPSSASSRGWPWPSSPAPNQGQPHTHTPPLPAQRWGDRGYLAGTAAT